MREEEQDEEIDTTTMYPSQLIIVKSKIRGGSKGLNKGKEKKEMIRIKRIKKSEEKEEELSLRRYSMKSSSSMASCIVKLIELKLEEF